MVGNDPAFLDRLAAATRADPARQLLFLEQLPPAAQAPAVARILAADPELRRYDDRGRARLFCLWANDPAALTRVMENHPAWQPVSWRCWARACASAGQTERACRIAAQFAPKPLVPPETPERRSVMELRAVAAASPGDPGAALRLARAQSAAGDQPGALRTLHAAAARPGGPSYIHYLEATAAAAVGQWTTGWEAWARYLETVPGEG